MTSFIIVSNNQDQIDKQLATIVKRFAIDQFDITLVSKKTDEKTKKAELKTTKSIGIEDIKLLQRKIFLKPMHGKMKAVVIKSGELLTTEAQNALLKVLEEPPIHTIIILTAKNKDAFLPTIQSRSFIIELQSLKKITETEKEEIASTLQTIEQITIPSALELSETLTKNKETVIIWLEKVISFLHQEMLEESDSNQLYYKSKLLKIFQKLYIEITTTNANIRLSTESTLLRLTK